MRDLLSDSATTAAVLISLPEEMPVNETLDLHFGLRGRVGIRVGATVLNSFEAPRFSPPHLAALKGSPELLPVALAHTDRAHLCEQARARLAQGVERPVFALPRLFDGARPGVDQALAEHARPLWEMAR